MGLKSRLKISISHRDIPLRTLTAATLVIAIVVACYGSYYWYLHSKAKHLHHHQISLAASIERIMFLDEVLTNSTRMAAITGDVQFVQRYQKYEPELDGLIQETRKKVNAFGLPDGMVHTSHANMNLVRMEKDAFKLIREGRAPEALALLASPQYIAEKEKYSRSVSDMSKELRVLQEKMEGQEQVYRLFLFWSGICGALVIFCAWVVFIRAAKLWNREREIAELTIRDRDTRYRLAARATNDAIWDWDLLTNEVRWNEGLTQLFGYPPSEIGLTADWWVEHIHPEDKERVATSIHAVIDNGGSSWYSEYRFRCHDGSYSSVIDRGYIVKDDRGKPCRMVGAMMDITERKRTQEAYNKVQERFTGIYQSSKDAIAYFSLSGLIVDVNDAFLRLTGYNKEDLIMKKTYREITTPSFHESESHVRTAILSSGEAAEYENEYLRSDGTKVSVWLTTFLVRGADGKPEGVASIIKDISEKKRIELERKKLSSAVEQSPSIVVITDTRGIIEYVNPKFTEITGYEPEEVIGKTPRILKADDIPSDDFKNLWETISGGGEWRGEFRNKKKNGEIYWELASISSIKDADGKITHFLAVKEDITRRKWAEETIIHMAYYDPLTDLPNRILFNDRLSQSLVQARRKRHPVATLLIGLDRFKMINDTLGHAIGDRVLQAVSKRLLGCVRECDTVARLGGDEFMLMLPETVTIEEAVRVAQQVIESLKPAFVFNGHEMHMTASIGISLYPYDGEDVETLLKNADTALNRAKEQGKNNYQLYTPTMNSEAFGRMMLENSMLRALERDEFVAYYQPQIDIQSGQIIGMEALIRWRHPDLGIVMPGEFIPVAEENGLIVAIGEWMLKRSCMQTKQWTDSGFPPLRVSVNLSARQFHQTDIQETVARILKETKLDPRFLELEITESIAMKNADYTIRVLRELKEMGISISIDDFGTGYSSLAYLKKFPIDILKIDRSFIRDILTDPNDAAIISAVIALAHSMKLKVTAEGVETQEQLEYLRQQNCDSMQGYLYSRPVPAEAFERLFMQDKRS